MKKLRTLSAIGLFALLTACGSTNTATPTGTTAKTTTETNRGRSNAEIASGRVNTITRGSDGVQETTAEDLAKAAAMEESRMQKMFVALNMDERQVNLFQSEWKKTMARWQANNRNQNLNSFERTEYQDKIMKDILNDSQFIQYQQWARDNAATDARN